MNLMRVMVPQITCTKLKLLPISLFLFIGCCWAGTRRPSEFMADVGAVKQHSFHSPLLLDPVESGFEAWSFGASAVVTDDGVLLSPLSGGGHGYLWNQYPSELTAWRAHFTLEATQRPSINEVHVDSCAFCGVAFWALNEPTRHGDSVFFGVPAHFVGIGAVMRDDGFLYLLARGTADGPADDVNTVSLGRCKPALLGKGVIHVVLEAGDPQDSIALRYRAHDGSGTYTDCLRVESVKKTPSRLYFGFTAYSGAVSPVGYKVRSIYVVPLNGDKEKAGTDERAAALFDHSLDAKEQEFWGQRGDTDTDPSAAPGGHSGASDGSNEKRQKGSINADPILRKQPSRAVPSDSDSDLSLDAN